ncbi:MAG TPA: TSUP family transporter [Clostridiaceae bacterium]
MDLTRLLIICPLVFIAGFVDSIAGGGGLISLPAYIFIGLPIHTAYGTNKFSSSFGTFLSALRFIKNRKVHFLAAIFSVITALIGSYLGARAALSLDDSFLKYTLIILIPIIAIFILLKKNFGVKDKTKERSLIVIIILSMLAGLILGAYDGFFGPGTGSFLILTFTTIIGFDILTASGNAKMINLASNVAALITFYRAHQVNLYYGVPAAICGILGNYIGSGIAIKRGNTIIKPLFIIVLILLLIKIVLDIV